MSPITAYDESSSWNSAVGVRLEDRIKVGVDIIQSDPVPVLVGGEAVQMLKVFHAVDQANRVADGAVLDETSDITTTGHADQAAFLCHSPRVF